MTRLQRIGNVLAGLALILCGMIVLVNLDLSFLLISVLMSIALMAAGIRTLIYYLTMTRHMVGGMTQLYVGIILLDFGAFAMTLGDAPQLYIVLYLIGIHVFSAIINVLRAKEARRFEAPWMLTAFQAVVNLIVAVLCVVFIGSPDVIAYVFCAGLFYSALMRIISAFRRTAIVYIQ